MTIDAPLQLDSKVPDGELADKWTIHRSKLKLVSPSNKRKLRILVVGTGLAGASAAATLAEQGYQIDVVNDGLAALEALARQPYDVVLMDLQMPKMDGLETTRRIRQGFAANEQPRIIAMTGHIRGGDREWCLSMGLDDYVGKPVDIGELIRALNRAQPLSEAEEKSSFTLTKKTKPVRSEESEEGIIDLATLDHLKESLAENGEGVLLQLMRNFYANARDLINKAHQALQDNQTEDLCRAAHTLKSASATFGAMTLANLAQELEELTENKIPDEAAQLIEHVEAEYVKAVAALETIRRQW